MPEINQARQLEVLVIDDEPLIRDLLKETIELFGHIVSTAANGEEGIDKFVQMLGTKPYNIVFTDLSMPGISGIGVVRAVKELSTSTPVYVVTGHQSDDSYKLCYEQLGHYKPDGILQKPFQLNEIKDIINQIKLRIRGSI